MSLPSNEVAVPIPFNRNLPATAEDLQRKSLRSRTLNDYVEDVFLRLYNEDERFKSLLEAVGNEDAVEGSTFADDIVAAQVIRDAAPDGSLVKRKNLSAIRRALNVVLRRYEISRSERARSLGGEIVPKSIDN
jgi:hypothetical protein